MASPLFELTRAALKQSKSKILIRMTPRGYAQVYITSGPLKLKSCNLKGLDTSDRAQLQMVVDFCDTHQKTAAKGELPPWHQLLEVLTPGEARVPESTLTWGELRSTVKAWIAPGGPKAKDSTPFSPFKDKGYFGQTYADATPVKLQHIEEVCLYTLDSLKAGKPEPRDYSSKGFYDQIQMVNHLVKKGAAKSIDLPSLQVTLKEKREKRQSRRITYLPNDKELEQWLDTLQEQDPLRGWVEAMRAVYALRPHEIWHLMALPGEVEDQPTWIQVANFESEVDQTKTGARFSLPCPDAWLERYQLLDLERSQQMLAQLRKRHDPTRLSNKRLGEVISHWYGNTKYQFKSPLMGWHQPPIRGGVVPKRERGRCTGYSIRHAWAHRAKATTAWPVALKAQSMGHAEAVHTSTYLRNEQAATVKENMMQLLKTVSNQKDVSNEKLAKIMELLNAS